MSYLMLPHAWMADLGGKGESSLGGKFLRMYLDHKVDVDAVKSAGEEIGASEKFSALAHETQAYVASRARQAHHGLPNATQLENDARSFLQTKLKTTGIEFRGKLNPVIGGVESVDVVPGKSTLVVVPGAGTNLLNYTITSNFGDEYHFNNHRTGLQDQFRKRLSTLVTAGRYADFWSEYHAAIEPHPFGTSPPASALGRAGVFACFMYALEMNGITSGLKWNVDIPMAGAIKYP